jgi:hypothetical protein
MVSTIMQHPIDVEFRLDNSIFKALNVVSHCQFAPGSTHYKMQYSRSLLPYHNYYFYGISRMVVRGF